MPAEQRGRGDDEARPTGPGQDARCCGEEEPVAAPQLGAAGFALQNLDLMAKDEDLDFTIALVP